MKLSKLGICGIISLLSYTAMVVFSPLAYPGYDWLSMRSLSVWAAVCLAAMLAGPLGTALAPKAVFGLFERFSTFSAVVFNAVLGWYLYTGRFDIKE